MGSKVIGHLNAPSGKRYQISWDEKDKNTYVDYAGGKNIGKASSPSEAMQKAEAWLFDK